MARTPSTAQLHRMLQDLVKKMELAEARMAEHGVEIEKLKRWHSDTEFAKKILKEYQDTHPEVGKNGGTLNAQAVKLVFAALAALTAYVIATT